ncbi:MAG TPA: alpha/beta hydrolase [Methyloceanibacter sp.]|nr:alpha/beta hydrolase [Methyloceanibacter sp.]
MAWPAELGRPMAAGGNVSTELPSATERNSQVLRLADGRRIGFAEYGDPEGQPVLAIHGTPGSRLMFALTDATARERRLRIVAPERPGYGFSDFHFQRSLAEAASDLEQCADALGLRRFALIGVSGGGPYAVAAAAAMPRRIALLALVNPVGPIAECDRRIRISKAHRLIFNRLGRSDAACTAFFWPLRRLVNSAPGLAYRVLQLRVPASDRTVLARDEVRVSLQAALREGLRPGIDGARQDLRLYCGKWQLSLRDIDVPAILWQGSDDVIVPPGAAYDLAETLPNCRLDVIQGGGHYWIFSGFDRVLDAARAALSAPATR